MDMRVASRYHQPYQPVYPTDPRRTGSPQRRSSRRSSESPRRHPSSPGRSSTTRRRHGRSTRFYDPNAPPQDENKWINEVIDGEYIIEKRIGGGSFSDCYVGKERRSGAPVCFKIEDPTRIRETPRLRAEYELLRELSKGVDLPKRRTARPLHFAQKQGCSLLVQELLGPNLGEITRLCGGKLSVNSIAFLAIQVLDCIRFVHDRGIVHRDVKPQNFLLGRGPDANRVLVVDFGLSKPYSVNKTHPKLGGRPAGTIRYVSLNAHRGVEQSRRDDLESVGYMLIHLLMGKLPWQGIEEPDKRKRHEAIFEVKARTSIRDLCKGCPPCFESYLETCRQLGFNEDPDYRYLRGLFERLRDSTGGYRPEKLDWRAKGVYTGGTGGASPTTRVLISDDDVDSYSYAEDDDEGPAPVGMLRDPSPMSPSSATTAWNVHESEHSGPDSPYYALPPGTEVHARFGDQYFPGRVHTLAADGTYTVIWDEDGSHTVGIHPRDVYRKAPSTTAPQKGPSHRTAVLYPTAKFRAGEPIEALYRGRAFPATIHGQESNGLYTVCWSDGTHSTGVSPYHIRRAHDVSVW